MLYSVSVEDIKALTNIDKPHIDVLCNGMPVRVRFAKQKTGFGEKRFMLCSRCNHRRVKLYLFNESLLCRNCISFNVYRELQHTTKGGNDYISYIMCRFAVKNGINFKFPFHYYEYEKPKYKHENKWCDNLKVMQALENMRFQAIFMRKIWNLKTIKSVLNWTNQLLYAYDLDEIDRYCINWDAGY